MRVALSAILVGAAVVACSSATPSASSSGPSPAPSSSSSADAAARSPCSTGAPYAWDASFPEGPSESSDPECVQRCGGPYPGVTWGAGGVPFPSTDAVPSGACLYEGEGCTMIAVRPFCSPTSTRGAAYRFVCRCTSGRWSCAAAYFGGGTESCFVDAGADAGN